MFQGLKGSKEDLEYLKPPVGALARQAQVFLFSYNTVELISLATLLDKGILLLDDSLLGLAVLETTRTHIARCRVQSEYPSICSSMRCLDIVTSLL